MSPAIAPLSGAAFRIERPVGWSVVDAARIVYFPAFFNLFQELVEAWFTQRLGVDYRRLFEERGVGLPTVHTECDFRRRVAWGETLVLGVEATHVGRSSIRLRFVGAVGDEPRLEARHVLVATSMETFRSMALPPDLRSALDAYRSACDA